jgi:hypothetical protein
VTFPTQNTDWDLFPIAAILYVALQYGSAQAISLISWAFAPLTRAAIARPVFLRLVVRKCETERHTISRSEIPAGHPAGQVLPRSPFGPLFKTPKTTEGLFILLIYLLYFNTL